MFQKSMQSAFVFIKEWQIHLFGKFRKSEVNPNATVAQCSYQEQQGCSGTKVATPVGLKSKTTD